MISRPTTLRRAAAVALAVAAAAAAPAHGPARAAGRHHDYAQSPFPPAALVRARRASIPGDLPRAAAGTPGSLDADFGDGGTVRTDFPGPSADLARAVAVQPDGKILVAGEIQGATIETVRFGVTRLEADGSLDAGFGENGSAAVDVGAFGTGLVSALAVLPDGGILAAGFAFEENGAGDMAIARLEADGSLDAEFGDGGVVLTGFGEGTFEGVRDIAVMEDGRIVVAGVTVSADGGSVAVALARYDASGRLDASLDGDGRLALNFPNEPFASAPAVAVAPGGAIVVSAQGSDFLLARRLADGAPDTGFGSRGFVATDFGGTIDVSGDVLVRPDGRVVAAGLRGETEEFRSTLAVAQYDASGRPDPSFGTGGAVFTPVQTVVRANALVLQPDGRIVAAGTADDLGASSMAAARYAENGALDASFGEGGVFVSGFGANASANAAAVAPDGAILLAGAEDTPSGPDFAVTRLTAAGRTDLTFGAEGTAHAGHTLPSEDGALAVAETPGGGLVAVGQTRPSDFAAPAFAVARYLADGSPDATFGEGGRATVDFGGDFDAANDVAVGPGGEVVVCGTILPPGGGRTVAVLRYTRRGLPDPKFGDRGRAVVTVPDAAGLNGLAVAVQPDGRIVVAGSRTTEAGEDLLVMRLTRRGALDGGFGDGGLVSVDLGESEILEDVAIAGGKIYAAGFQAVSATGEERGVVARFDRRGRPDAGFGDGGVALVEAAGGRLVFAALAVLRGGRVVAAGRVLGDDFSADAALARLERDGSPDGSFGEGGLAVEDLGGYDELRGLAAARDGALVAAGSALNEQGGVFAVARFLEGGRPDPSFGDGGRVLTAVSPLGSSASDVLVDARGRVVAAGYARARATGGDFALARYLGGS